MSASSRSETQETLTQELWKVATSSPSVDQDLAVKIGTRVAMRRSLCGLSKLQLAARLGIDAADVSSFERGAKRMSCKLLLEAARQLKATQLSPCLRAIGSAAKFSSRARSRSCARGRFRSDRG